MHLQNIFCNDASRTSEQDENYINTGEIAPFAPHSNKHTFGHNYNKLDDCTPQVCLSVTLAIAVLILSRPRSFPEVGLLGR